ncbi:MAG TPA: DUF3786 domain-containing protein [Phycisphaerae bacterium]|nr:DUF3786 domain-containing protein [Phycisphaerae bacterium]
MTKKPGKFADKSTEGSGEPATPGGYRPPPPQENLNEAFLRALAAVRDQQPEQMQWLGAHMAGGTWRLPVLDDVFEIDLASGHVHTSEGGEMRLAWRILTLHYLGVKSTPPGAPPEITFPDLPAGRVYAKVYHARVNLRLCATVGRDLTGLSAAANALGARSAEGGDAAFDLTVFPRLPVRLIWYAADEEFEPSATLLLPRNIESFLSVEDIVVLSEGLVSRLSGKEF